MALASSARCCFINLMDLYEGNYNRLRRLIPQLPPAGRQRISVVSDCLDLHLSVLEETHYTLTLRLTYHFDSGPRRYLEPDLVIRLYRDLQLAECRQATIHQCCYHVDSLLWKKWYLNRFLYKWLGYCLQRGHAFTPDSLQQGLDFNAGLDGICAPAA